MRMRLLETDAQSDGHCTRLTSRCLHCVYAVYMREHPHVHLIETYSNVVKNLKFRNCQTDPLCWLQTLRDIRNSLTVENISFAHCRKVDLDVLWHTPTSLAPIEELGATQWVGNAKICKGLRQIGRRIVQQWGPPLASGVHAAIAQFLPNPLVALPTSTQ